MVLSCDPCVSVVSLLPEMFKVLLFIPGKMPPNNEVEPCVTVISIFIYYGL